MTRPSTTPPARGAAPSVALIGMMASGKSTVGRGLARRLGLRFVDTDEQIEAATGRTVQELWRHHGETGYRPLERKAVQDALTSADPVVLATPGGVAVDPAMAALLDDPHVVTVYLRARASTLAARVGGGQDHRPLLGDDPAAVLDRLVKERGGRYEELADHIVDVDDRTPDEIVEAALVALDR